VYILYYIYLGGNHRKSLVENLDASLKRLNMSYVDILYVHFYEYRTPIEEFMRSLDDVVRSGKVRQSYF
jgi:aryl-alcohol dehydrogenase-like predicted oxidoreductase